MEYIDWIISATVFLMVLIVVFNIIPQNLPLQDNTTDLFTAENVYNSILENIDTYNIENNNINNYLRANSFEIDENESINNSINSYFVVDGNKVYTTYNKKSNFFYKEGYTINNNIGVKILEEGFEDWNYLDSFQVIDGNSPTISYDALELKENTKIKTNNSFFDFNSSLYTNCFDLNIYFNYIDSTNYNLLEISSSTQNLISCIAGACTIENTKNIIKNTDWRKIYFGSTYDNNIVGIIDNEILNKSLDVDLNKGNIIIENINDACIIDDFKVYKNYDLNVNADINNIQTNYFDVNINNSNINIDLLDNRNKFGEIDINFEEDLIFDELDTNKIKVIKDPLDNTKLIVYPNTQELWFNINSGEDLNINTSNLDLNTLPYYIEDTNEEFNIWTKVDLLANSTKTIYLSKINGSDANGDAVFEFFDDFEDGTIDTDKWGYDTGTVEIINDELHINGASYIVSKQTYNWNNKILETNYKSIYHGSGKDNGYFLMGEDYNLGWYSNTGVMLGNNEWSDGNYDIGHFQDCGGNNLYQSTTPVLFDEYLKYQGFVNSDKNVQQKVYNNSNTLLDNSGWKTPNSTCVRDTGYLGLTTDAGSGEIYVKYIFLREYTPNEPTVTIRDLENGLYKIEITNNESSDLNDYQVRIPNDIISISSKDQKLQLIDLEDLKDHHLLILNDFKENKTINSNCNITYFSENININNCPENSTISLQIINEDNIEYLDNNYNDNITKIKKTYIFEDNLLDLNINNDYYINIVNKGLDLNFGVNRRINTNLLERYSNFINSNGEKEIVKVLIKPY